MMEIRWFIGSTADFWGRGSGFESGISHNEPDDTEENLWVERYTNPWGKKDI